MPNTVLETITVDGTTYDLPSGGSGMTSHIIVISDAGSTVTVTLPSGTVKTCTQVSGSTTQWETTSDEYGIHTIDAVKDGDDAQTTLNITMVGEYVVHDEHFTYTINVTAMSGSTIVVSGGSETYTGTGTGSALAFVVHGKNTTYTISVTVDGVSKTDSVTTGSTSGQSSSVTIQFGTINVTYENDFRGVSITCTLGGTTITKTAPSVGNTMSFYPPTTGQWTISGTVGGIPYSTTATVTSLSTPASATLQTTTTISVTMYGAAGATISYTNTTGSKTCTLNSSGQGSATVTFIPPSATITFTDTNVSKNPNNLSQNYSKSITLTESTTSIKVMPDNSLYWWGYNGGIQDMSSSDGWSIGDGWLTPTWNTTNITLNSASSKNGGVASINQITTKTIAYIGKFTSTSSSDRVGVRLLTSKSSTDYNTNCAIHCTVPDSVVEYESATVASDATGWLTAMAGWGGGTKMELYALWYE